VPELPDVTVYVDALRERVLGQPLTRVRLRSFFLLRTATPKLPEAHGRAVTSVARLGKRIVLGLESGDFLVLHLMVTGRLRWRKAGARPPGKIGLAAFDFPTGRCY
jgi:formamidopyrimidine-DNA glycosylase